MKSVRDLVLKLHFHGLFQSRNQISAAHNIKESSESVRPRQKKNNEGVFIVDAWSIVVGFLLLSFGRKEKGLPGLRLQSTAQSPLVRG